MLLPEFLYGTEKEVVKASKKIVRLIKKSRSTTPLDELTMIDSSGGDIILKKVLNFHKQENFLIDSFLLNSQPIEDDEELENLVFQYLLKHPWGLLCLLSESGQCWLMAQSRHKKFLRAVLEFWDELNSALYLMGTAKSEKLWDAFTSLQYVLANMNVPQPVLASPLPESGLQALIDQYKLLD